jgi:hypothetical protein
MSERGTTVQATGKENKVDVALHCPWCGIVSRVASGVQHITKTRDGVQLYATVVCQVRECNRAVFLVIDDVYDRFFKYPQAYPAKVFPSAEASYKEEGVPPQIAKEFCEALECSWNGHAIGAALVGRRVLQAACRNVLGGRRRDLETEIRDVPDERLNKGLKDQATHVRLLGNDAAHVDPIDPADVDDLLGFVEAVLDALYVTPAKVAKLQQKRDAARAARDAARAPRGNGPGRAAAATPPATTPAAPTDDDAT